MVIRLVFNNSINLQRFFFIITLLFNFNTFYYFNCFGLINGKPFRIAAGISDDTNCVMLRFQLLKILIHDKRTEPIHRQWKMMKIFQTGPIRLITR